MQSESVKSLVVQLCLILSDLMDCSPPGSSVHGILQARILEWLPFPSPGDLPNPGIKPRSPALQADSLPFESPGKPWIHLVKFWAGWNPSWNQDWQGKYNNVRYADDTTLMVEREEELKSLLMMMKEESEKAGLKLNNQKTTIMASGSITSWQIDGGEMETVKDFIFLGSKITADSDYSLEIKRHLLLGREAMTNLDSILKSRDITLMTKVHIVKAMVFPIIMYGCESWIIKKAECQRIDALELWCWRRLLRVPWTARRSNHTILKEINPEYSLEGLMLKLKLQYFGHQMWRADLLEKTLLLGKIQGRRMTEHEVIGQHHWLNGHEFEQIPGGNEGQGSLTCCSPWSRKESDMTEQLNKNKKSSVPKFTRHPSGKCYLENLQPYNKFYIEFFCISVKISIL